MLCINLFEMLSGQFVKQNLKLIFLRSVLNCLYACMTQNNIFFLIHKLKQKRNSTHKSIFYSNIRLLFLVKIFLNGRYM